jgi:hypothetical protein
MLSVVTHTLMKLQCATDRACRAQQQQFRQTRLAYMKFLPFPLPFLLDRASTTKCTVERVHFDRLLFITV